MTKTKVCNPNNGCGLLLPIDNFYWIKVKGIYSTNCKSCFGIQSKSYRDNSKRRDPEAYDLRVKEQKQKQIEKDPAAFKLKTKEYDRAKRLGKQKENPELLKKQEKDKREELKAKNPEKYLQYKRDAENKRLNRLREENPDKLKAIQNKLGAKAREKLTYRLHQAISGTMGKDLKRNESSKHGKKTFQNVGYTKEDLKQHLETLFEPWMTWDNWGPYRLKEWKDDDQSTWRWQIDHILPRSEFIFDSFEHADFKKCWALSNLRPLSAKQNVIDGTHRTRHKGKNDE